MKSEKANVLNGVHAKFRQVHPYIVASEQGIEQSFADGSQTSRLLNRKLALHHHRDKSSRTHIGVAPEIPRPPVHTP